jgi:hypothetical protein
LRICPDNKSLLLYIISLAMERARQDESEVIRHWLSLGIDVVPTVDARLAGMDRGRRPNTAVGNGHVEIVLRDYSEFWAMIGREGRPRPDKASWSIVTG